MKRSSMDYETKYYSIKKIPLQWEITIKKSLVLKQPWTQIGRKHYSVDYWGRTIEDAKALAERLCEEHFRPKTEEEVAMYSQKP